MFEIIYTREERYRSETALEMHLPTYDECLLLATHSVPQYVSYYTFLYHQTTTAINLHLLGLHVIHIT
jgi:hypothetical protein